MKRKRSVQMITKLIIICLFLGLWLPSFSSIVQAEEADYSLNVPAIGKYYVYYKDNSNTTKSGKMTFRTAESKEVGNLHYIVLYQNAAKYPSTTKQNDDGTASLVQVYDDDAGYFAGINIPLKDTESDWSKYLLNNKYDTHFNGITFEDARLNWNFSENPVSNRMYVTTVNNKRIPIYFLAGYFSNSNYRPLSQTVPYVTEQDIENLNVSLEKLYTLVTDIENNGETKIGGYYPEHAELLKTVACEARQILLSESSVEYDSAYNFPTEENGWPERWKNGKYRACLFQGMKKIIDGYIDYVNTHKIKAPTITSAKINGKNVTIDNKNLEIIIDGTADEYKDKELSILEFELPEGLRGSWDADASFSTENLYYNVMPYNENLGDSDLDKYSNLGIKYKVVFQKFYKPTINVDPAGLNGADISIKSNTIASTKKTSYEISAALISENVTDSNNQHYAFSHWEVDEDNRDELESDIMTSDHSAHKLHGSTSVRESFTMPSKEVTITAKYEQAYRIETESAGLQDDETFELSTTDLALRGWNVPEKEIELYYYDSAVPSGYIVKDVQVITTEGKTVSTILSSKANTNFIHFYMPASDVKVTVTFEKDMDNTRQLVLGEPSGMLIEGLGGTATYELTTTGYSDNAVFTVQESFSTGTAVSSQTDGLTISLGDIISGKGIITVTVDPKVKVGEYYFCVTPSEGKLTAIGTITVLSADTKVLKVENTSITLKENEAGEVKIKGSGMNLSAGASVEAFETDQDGQIKYSGKTEGLTFDKAVLNNDAFSLTAYVSKTVAKGEYYFIVKADNEQSAVAKLTVDREKAETPDQPDQPDQPEKETQKITVTSNSGQGSIQVKVAGGSEELISGTGTVKAVEGDKVTVTAVPKDGYKLSVWKITQGMKDVALSSGSSSDSSVSFVMPAVSGTDTVTVGATFDKTSTDTIVTSEPKITAFSVVNVSGTIDQNSGTITIVVPNGTDVTSLCPAIATSDADSVTPASGAAVNFTNAVTYTVKNASGEQKSYVVTVKVQEASVSDTLWDKITSQEGDRSWWKKADSIKSHKKNKYPKYW